MHLYVLISTCGFFQLLETQYVNIWSDNMSTNNKWIGYNNFNLTWSSDNCIVSPCLYVIADNNERSYIEKITNITFYSSTQFQVDINAHNQKPTDYCQIWYNFDNSVYIKRSEWSNGKFRNITINFPPSTTATIISIRLQVIGNHSICFWDNAILMGIPIPVKMRNITTTDNTSFSRYTKLNPSTFILIIFIIIIISPILCYIAIIILRSLSQTNKKTNIQNLQTSTSTMEIMSTLQLSEYDILSKYSYDPKQPDNCVICMYSQNTTTNATSDHCIIPLKKGNFATANQSVFYDNENVSLSNIENISTMANRNYCFSEDNYPTPANTPVSRRQHVQVKLVNESKSDTHDAKNSLSVSKIERMLNLAELEMEMLQQILDECKYECSSTDANTDSMSETTVEMDTITDTNLNNASMCVHLDGIKYIETFL
eukprot:339299_1